MQKPQIRFLREFAMPNAETFSIPPIAKLLSRWLGEEMVVVDPFARNSKRGTVTNDLNPTTDAEYHMLAEEFVEKVAVEADAVLFDPPYSPRQIAECYQQVGRTATMQDTQSSRLYKRVKDGLDQMLKPNGIAICCGWNSLGFGLTRGYEMLEILLVTHGGAHNDTIVTVERKIVTPALFDLRFRRGGSQESGGGK
jgi:hypothetical protein